MKKVIRLAAVSLPFLHTGINNNSLSHNTCHRQPQQTGSPTDTSLILCEVWHKNWRFYSQTLQRDQKAEITRLEQEVHTMRGKHSEAIQKLKSQFLREKRSYQKESDTKIHEMAQQASQVCWKVWNYLVYEWLLVDTSPTLLFHVHVAWGVRGLSTHSKYKQSLFLPQLWARWI